jgi:hypothetical protein
MKKFIFFIMTFYSFSSYAQKLKELVTVGASLESAFLNRKFYHGGLGLEYSFKPYLKPEAEITFYLGELPESSEVNAQFIETSLYYRSVYALNLSIRPKFTLEANDNESGDGYFQIIPIYNFTRVEAKGEYYSLVPNQNDLTKTNVEHFVEYRHSVGIGLGYYINLSEIRADALALNLYMEGIDLGNALSSLHYSKSEIHTNTVIGAGIIYYFKL